MGFWVLGFWGFEVKGSGSRVDLESESLVFNAHFLVKGPEPLEQVFGRC